MSTDYRLMSAMVLFNFEQALGNWIIEKTPSINEEIADLAEHIQNRETQKRPSLKISNTSELIAETYIEDLFQLLLRITKETSNFELWLSLKNYCSSLDLYQIRNAVAHPNRPFPSCYWYRMAAIATDPLLQQLDLVVVTNAFDSAREGKIEIPPDNWMKLPEWCVPNNLPNSNDFEITGLIGRPKETKELSKLLLNPRISCISVVAPGGLGKTALVLDLLDKSCKTPEFHNEFDAVIFLTLKLEKLTANGIVNIDAPTTIQEIKNNLTSLIPQVLGDEVESTGFDEILVRYRDSRLLLFIDNLETLLRDTPEHFDKFQMNLPVHWRLLVTSRITMNSATCLPLGPLADVNAKHLVRIYATRRNASGLVSDDVVDKIIARTRCNPLAIRLGVDGYILGSSLDISLDASSKEVLNFSYRNLLEVISKDSTLVLECLFLKDPQSRIELAENSDSSIDSVAAGLNELTRTSLVTRESGESQELYSLYPAIRDLLLIHPRDPELRLRINSNILKRREFNIGAESAQKNLSKHHFDFVPADLPDVVRNIFFETNRILKKIGKISSREDALKLLERLRILQIEYPATGSIRRYIAKINIKLGDSSTAQNELLMAIQADSTDILALQMLGRLSQESRDYKRAKDCYSKIKELNGWNPKVTDDIQAKSVCNGYFLARLYLGEYEEILQETQNWDTNQLLKSNIGAFRARAWKRSIERETNTAVKCQALNKSANILENIVKQYGYAEWILVVFHEVFEEIAKAAEASLFKQCKEASRLLYFVNMHIQATYKDDPADVSEIIKAVSHLNTVNITNNPFKVAEWDQFLKSGGGRIYIDEDIKNELKEDGYSFAKIYHIPSVNSVFLFAKDERGIQCYVNFKVTKGITWQEWICLKEGEELALKISPSTSTDKAQRAEDAILLSRY